MLVKYAMSRIIGIDLGTTYSCGAISESGRIVIIPNALGGRLTPSVVRILPGGDVVVGEHAFKNRFLDPTSTITGIKRLIGRRYNEVLDIIRTLPYEVCPGENNLAAVRIRDEIYTPQFISAMILKSLKSDAEQYLGETVDSAVITVPAYFNDIQRQATKEAGKIAGLEVKRIINEPTSACLAYGLDKKLDNTVAVFDLGGGTFDLSIMEVGEGVCEVKSTGGDGFLGGDDFDERITSWLVEDFLAAYDIDISADHTAMHRLRAAAVAAKHELSEIPRTRIQIPFLASRDGVSRGLDVELGRDTFQEICEELFDRFRQPCLRTMTDAGIRTADLDDVVLVGGATRTWGMDRLVQSIFGKPPAHSVNPDEAVALGAAALAGVFEGEIKDLLLLDVTPLTLAIETLGGVSTPMIPRNTTIPTKKTETFSTASDNQTSVELHVLQGERPMANGNRSLGRLALQGIAPAPKHIPSIEVTFDIDANGILNVHAKDTASGREVLTTILPFTGLDRQRLENLAQVRSTIRPV
jgi:molecular chaperone DnaK